MTRSPLAYALLSLSLAACGSVVPQTEQLAGNDAGGGSSSGRPIPPESISTQSPVTTTPAATCSGTGMEICNGTVVPNSTTTTTTTTTTTGPNPVDAGSSGPPVTTTTPVATCTGTGIVYCNGSTTTQPPRDGGATTTTTSTERPDAADTTTYSGGAACHTASDCGYPGSWNCLGPISDESICLAYGYTCTNGAECGAGMVCRTGSGAQPTGGGPACRPPCASDGDCNYWESCQSDGLCKALPCSKCPSYLSCAQDACGPKACQADSECPGGFCVDQTCFATLGYCAAMCE